MSALPTKRSGMDWLYNLFGPGPAATNSYGPMMGGLLDDPAVKNDMLTQGLLGLAGPLLEAAGPSPRRTSIAQALGRGLQASRQGSQGVVDQALRAKMVGLEFDKFGLDKQKTEAEIAALAQTTEGRTLMMANPPKSWTGTMAQWQARVAVDTPGAAKQYDPQELTFIQGKVGQGAGTQDVVQGVDKFTGQPVGAPVMSGDAFAPPAPQRLPLDATVWDPNALDGQGGQVYAHGPLAGQVAKPGDVNNVDTTTIRFPDGRIVSYDSKDPALKAALTAGGIKVNLAAQSTNVSDLFTPGTARTTELQGEIARSEDTLSLINTAMDIVNGPAADWSTGIKGWAAEKGGGLVQALSGLDPTATLSGPPLEQIQAARTTFRSLIGRLIPAVTGDQTGRYSNNDRMLAEEAQRALDPTASDEQVRGALTSLQMVEQRANARKRVELAGLNLRSPEGQREYVRSLMSVNPKLTVEQAAAMVKQDLSE